VTQVCKAYQVSKSSVYRWIDTFAVMKEKKERLIVESKSEAALIKRLREELAEAQRKIGQQQILIDYKDKLIEIAEEHYKIDIKKNSSSGSSAGSGKKEKS
jgi:transposase